MGASRIRAALRAIGWLVVLGACASGATSPQGVVDRYVAAVRSSDARAAYALLDRETRASISFEEFERLMKENQRELSEQANHLAKLDEGALSAEADVHLSTGEVTTLKKKKGVWWVPGDVIGEPSLRTPQETVAALRRAITRRSLHGVLRVLSRGSRAELETEMTQLLEDTEDELDLAYETQGNDARVRTTSGREIVLRREAGQWKVVEVGDRPESSDERSQ